MASLCSHLCMLGLTMTAPCLWMVLWKDLKHCYVMAWIEFLTARFCFLMLPTLLFCCRSVHHNPVKGVILRNVAFRWMCWRLVWQIICFLFLLPFLAFCFFCLERNLIYPVCPLVIILFKMSLNVFVRSEALYASNLKFQKKYREYSLEECYNDFWTGLDWTGLSYWCLTSLTNKNNFIEFLLLHSFYLGYYELFYEQAINSSIARTQSHDKAMKNCSNPFLDKVTNNVGTVLFSHHLFRMAALMFSYWVLCTCLQKSVHFSFCCLFYCSCLI